jgi:hypothetical protein
VALSSESAPIVANAPPDHASGTAPAPGLAGDYRCSITDGGYTYPPYACSIFEDAEGGYMLHKLGGSQRFAGPIVATAAGFTFSGKFFCPEGACDQAITGTFVRRGGAYVGQFAELPQMSIRLAPVAAAGVGGASYGGVGYAGGNMYGDATYGGASYGTLPSP